MKLKDIRDEKVRSALETLGSCSDGYGPEADAAFDIVFEALIAWQPPERRLVKPCVLCEQPTKHPLYCIECDMSGRSREHERSLQSVPSPSEEKPK